MRREAQEWQTHPPQLRTWATGAKLSPVTAEHRRLPWHPGPWAGMDCSQRHAHTSLRARHCPWEHHQSGAVRGLRSLAVSPVTNNRPCLPGASPSGPRLRASGRKHIRMPGSGCPSFRLHGLQTANPAGSGALSVARGVVWWLGDQRGPRSPVPGQGALCFPDSRSRPLPPASWRHEVTFPPACWLLWRPSGLTILTRLSFLAPLSCCPCDAGESLPLLCLCPLALPKESHLSWATLQGCEAAALWLEFLPSSSEYTFS